MQQWKIGVDSRSRRAVFRIKAAAYELPGARPRRVSGDAVNLAPAWKVSCPVQPVKKDENVCRDSKLILY